MKNLTSELIAKAAKSCLTCGGTIILDTYTDKDIEII